MILFKKCVLLLDPGVHVHSYIETAHPIFLRIWLIYACMDVCKFICKAHFSWKHATNDAKSAIIGYSSSVTVTTRKRKQVLLRLIEEVTNAGNELEVVEGWFRRTFYFVLHF